MSMAILGQARSGRAPRRYYDPTTAQFTSPDLLDAITGSRYGYAGNDAINGTEPSGLSTCGHPSGLGDLLGSVVDCGSKTGHDAAQAAGRGAKALRKATGICSSYADQAALHTVMNIPASVPRFTSLLAPRH